MLSWKSNFWSQYCSLNVSFRSEFHLQTPHFFSSIYDCLKIPVNILGRRIIVQHQWRLGSLRVPWEAVTSSPKWNPAWSNQAVGEANMCYATCLLTPVWLPLSNSSLRKYLNLRMFKHVCWLPVDWLEEHKSGMSAWWSGELRMEEM